MEISEGEIWMDAVGYNGYYLISTYGRVATMNGSTTKCFKKLDKPRLLKPCKHKDGHLQVCLRKNGKAIVENVHRLVALAFIPNPENKECINHIDYDKANNHISNLEWTTRAENNAHGLQNKNTKSKYLGVSFKEFARVGKRKKPWMARIYIGKKQIFNGYFATDLEAHLANEAARVKYGIVNKYSKPKDPTE